MTARRSARPGEGGAITPSVPARPRGGWLEHALADAVQDGLLVLDAALRIAA